MERLWSPWRMAYISAEKEHGFEGSGCVFCDLPAQHDDARTYRGADDVLGLSAAELLLRERHDLAEGQREVEGGVRDGAEVRVRARTLALRTRFVGDDREIDLL